MADQGKVGRCVIRLVYVHPSVEKDLIAAISEKGCCQNQIAFIYDQIYCGHWPTLWSQISQF